MKKNQIVFIIFLCVAMSVSAQNQKKTRFYDLEKVATITEATPEQRLLLEKALRKRKEAVLKAENTAQQVSANVEYYENFIVIFDNIQQEKLYSAQVDDQIVKTNALSKHEALISSFNFPENYKAILKEIIYDFEYRIDYKKKKYPLNSELQKTAVKTLVKAQSKWRLNQQKFMRKSEKLWDKTLKNATNLQQSDHLNFIAYHFYTMLLPNIQQHYKENIRAAIYELASDPQLKYIANKIAAVETNALVSNFKELNKLDAASMQIGREEIFKFFSEELQKKLTNFEPLTINPTSSLKKDVLSLISENKKERTTELLVAKATKAGLDKTRTDKLIDLIAQREASIKGLNQELKVSNSNSTLLNNSARSKEFVKVKKKFSEDLSQLITKKEFAYLFMNELEEKAKVKAEKEFLELKNLYNLNEKQKKEIRKILKTFYLNETITNAYYAYNKAMLKQKLSLIRYKFQKEYQQLLKSFDIEVAELKKNENRTFQWE